MVHSSYYIWNICGQPKPDAPRGRPVWQRRAEGRSSYAGCLRGWNAEKREDREKPLFTVYDRIFQKFFTFCFALSQFVLESTQYLITKSGEMNL